MALVMKSSEVAAPETAASTAFELKVSIGKNAAFGFLLDPSGGAAGPEQFRHGRKRLPYYYEWLRVPSEPALSLVDQLMPTHPELVPRQPFALLAAPRWAAGEQSVEVFVNTAFRRHNELLVRVPAWTRQLGLDQPIERWVALQPHLSQLGKVGLIGVETSSTGRRALEVFVRVEELRTADLRRLGAVAGAPAGELIHLWRTLSACAGTNPGTTLVSLRLAGEESLDVGVSFPAWRAGSSADIQKRLQWLARVHGLETTRYVQSIDELTALAGSNPEHTMLGCSSENGGVVLTASFESVAASYAERRAS